RTSGRWTTASSSILPGKLRRERSQASATANGKLAATLQKATLRLRRRAWVSSGERLHTRSVYGEAVLLENSPRFAAAEELDEGAALRVRAFQDRHRVNDRRMTVRRKHASDHHAGLCSRVSLVDDAQGRLAARHKSERCAYILRRGDAA